MLLQCSTQGEGCSAQLTETWRLGTRAERGENIRSLARSLTRRERVTGRRGPGRGNGERRRCPQSVRRVTTTIHAHACDETNDWLADWLAGCVCFLCVPVFRSTKAAGLRARVNVRAHSRTVHTPYISRMHHTRTDRESKGDRAAHSKMYRRLSARDVSPESTVIFP